MFTAILLLVVLGLCWVSVGAAVGRIERCGWSLVRYQILLCLVCIALGLAEWAVAPAAMFPRPGCPTRTWALVIAGTLLSGVFNYLMILAMGWGMRRGPNAIVWAIIQSGLIYPFLMGWLVFNVPMGPRRFCGIVLIVASVFLYASRTTGKETPGSGGAGPLRQWLPAALLGMLCCGINQCGANLPSYLESGQEFSGTFRTFMLYAGILLSALLHIVLQRVRGSRAAPPKPGEMRGLAVWTLGIGVLSFLAAKYLAFPGLDKLESLGAGSMGYPVAVAACIIGFFPYGVFVLRERIDARQAVGAVLGLVGILLGCL